MLYYVLMPVLCFVYIFTHIIYINPCKVAIKAPILQRRILRVRYVNCPRSYTRKR